MDIDKDQAAKLRFQELVAMVEWAEKELSHWKIEHKKDVYNRDAERRLIYWQYLHEGLIAAIQSRCDLIAGRSWEDVG